MTSYFIAPIVEGHGEVQAIPILLQRLLLESRPDGLLRVNPALRVKTGSFLRDRDYFARYLELAARKARAQPRGSVLVLLDCEDDCPAEAGPRLACQAVSLHPAIPITVALAHREYETWFLAAARSLRGVRGLPADLDAPEDPEVIRDAKGWLNARMPATYNEPNDQPIFTREFSFGEASSVPSFARLRSKLRSLFSA